MSDVEQSSAARPVVEFDHHNPWLHGDRQDGTDQRVFPPMLQCARQIDEPIAWSESYGGFWIVMSHELVTQIQADPQTFTNERMKDASDGAGGMFVPPSPETVPGLGMLPGEAALERNNQVRRAVIGKFTQKLMNEVRPEIQALVDARMRDLAERDEIDIISDVGHYITPAFIATYLGYDEKDRDLCRQAIHLTLMTELTDDQRWLQQQFIEVTMGLIHARREQPVDDIVSMLAHHEDGAFSDMEIGAILWTLILGGIETTTGSTANTLLYLQHHPELKAQVLADPEVFIAGAGEFLRYFTPTMHAGRTATRDVEIAGQQIHRGDRVLLAYQAANHDPAVFDAPDTIDLCRSQKNDVVFGRGVHRCPGQFLARIQYEVMVTSFLAHMPDYVLDAERARRSPHVGTVNGWETMPARPKG